MSELMEMDGDENNAEVLLQTHNPRARKLRSPVWKDFTKERRADGNMVAICNHCKKQLTASSRSGTTHLKNHLTTCIGTNGNTQRAEGRTKRRKLLVRRPGHIDYEVRNDGASNVEGSQFDQFHFDQDLCRQDLARMIILHEYPLAMVEHVGFRSFVKNLQPRFKLMSYEAVKADCMKIYETARVMLYEVLDKLRSRVSLTVDMWNLSEDAHYMSLTCHYVDNDWKLQKKILNLLHYEAPPVGEEISKFIVEKLHDWKINKKISSIVLDNCGYSEAVIDELLKFLRPKGALILNGGMFYVHGCSHIFNLIVQDGLEAISNIPGRVRDCVKYVKSSQERIKRFQKATKEVQGPQKSLILDVTTSWISTYSMLATACEFQDTFMRLSDCDSEFPHFLSPKDWDEVKAVTECLEVFYQAIKKFSGARVPTANLYFNDACGIRLLLKTWLDSPLSIIVLMASGMLEKFQQYWEVTGTVMAIASILDPRYKMKSIEYFYKKIYDGEGEADVRVENIRKVLTNLYNEYLVRSTHNSGSQSLLCYAGNSGTSNMDCGTGVGFKTSSRITLQDTQRGLDQYLQETSSTQSVKSDLDMYLEESVYLPKEGLDDSFNVLAWWKFNEAKYPILSLVARDVLAMPVSVVALSTEDRSLNQYFNSMDPVTIQGLLCAQDWLRDELEDKVDGGVVKVPSNGNESYPLLQ